MLGRDYELYDKALAFLGREAYKLGVSICAKQFATRTIQNNYSIDTKMIQISWGFFLNGQSAIITVITVIKIKGPQNRTRFKFHLVHTRTGRYEELLILYMTKILNSNLTHYSLCIVDYN